MAVSSRLAEPGRKAVFRLASMCGVLLLAFIVGYFGAFGRSIRRDLRTLPQNADIHQIVLTSSKVGWAILGGYGPHGSLFRTTDSGVHWTPAGPLKPLHTKARRR